MRRAAATLGFAIGAVLTYTAAVTLAAETDPLAGDMVAELDVARAAEESGDARLLAVLQRASLAEASLESAGERAGMRRLAVAAVRAGSHALAPEQLIVPLAKLACGRDPVLAPEAAQALLKIAPRLSSSELASHEALRDDLRQARAALACVDAKPIPRADIAIALAQLAAALDAVLR